MEAGAWWGVLIHSLLQSLIQATTSVYRYLFLDSYPYLIYTRCLFPYLYPHQYLNLYQTRIYIIFFSLFIIKHWCARHRGFPFADWRSSWLHETCRQLGSQAPSTQWCSPWSHQSLGGVLSTEVVKGDGSSALIFRVETHLQLYLFSRNIQTRQIYKIRPQCCKLLLVWSFPIWAKKKKKKSFILSCRDVQNWQVWWGCVTFGGPLMACHTIWPIFYLLKIILFIYLFLSMLGLHYCEGVFSSGGKQRLLWLRCTSLSLQGLLSWWNGGSWACGLL